VPSPNPLSQPTPLAGGFGWQARSGEVLTIFENDGDYHTPNYISVPRTFPMRLITASFGEGLFFFMQPENGSQ
jgi:hypothetical protein